MELEVHVKIQESQIQEDTKTNLRVLHPLARHRSGTQKEVPSALKGQIGQRGS